MFYEIILFILLVYAIVISVLYFNDLNKKSQFQKETLELISKREEELKRRESIVVDKELCFRELTKMKTIQNSILDMLSRDSEKINDTPSA
jgi:hypothetical protein